jgi:hypothetical protein
MPQVRTAQLDKEAAELRDETAHLQQVQNQMGTATAQGLKQQVRCREDLLVHTTFSCSFLLNACWQHIPARHQWPQLCFEWPCLPCERGLLGQHEAGFRCACEQQPAP